MQKYSRTSKNKESSWNLVEMFIMMLLTTKKSSKISGVGFPIFQGSLWRHIRIFRKYSNYPTTSWLRDQKGIIHYFFMKKIFSHGFDVIGVGKLRLLPLNTPEMDYSNFLSRWTLGGQKWYFISFFHEKHISPRLWRHKRGKTAILP